MYSRGLCAALFLKDSEWAKQMDKPLAPPPPPPKEPSIWHDLGSPHYRRWLLRATLYEFGGSLLMIFLMAASAESLVRIGNAVLTNDAMGHGMAAFIATYITIHVSGALLNPALTLAMWTIRRLDALTVVTFTLAQAAGSLAAAGILRGGLGTLTRGVGVPLLTGGVSVGQGILLEAMMGGFLFWLMAVHYLRGQYFFYKNAYHFHHPGPVRPIFSALMAFAYAAGFEAAFVTTVGTGPNPIRWLGPAVVSGSYTNWPVWLAGPYAGTLIGAGIYLVDWAFLRPEREMLTRRMAAKEDKEVAAVLGKEGVFPPPLNIFGGDDIITEGRNASRGTGAGASILRGSAFSANMSQRRHHNELTQLTNRWNSGRPIPLWQL